MLRLDFYAAARYNLLSIILFPVLTVFLVLEAKSYIEGKVRRSRGELVVALLLVVVAIVYCIMRNLPMFAFLQPTEAAAELFVFR